MGSIKRYASKNQRVGRCFGVGIVFVKPDTHTPTNKNVHLVRRFEFTRQPGLYREVKVV